jgi:hypothetical protein
MPALLASCVVLIVAINGQPTVYGRKTGGAVTHDKKVMKFAETGIAQLPSIWGRSGEGSLRALIALFGQSFSINYQRLGTFADGATRT